MVEQEAAAAAATVVLGSTEASVPMMMKGTDVDRRSKDQESGLSSGVYGHESSRSEFLPLAKKADALTDGEKLDGLIWCRDVCEKEAPSLSGRKVNEDEPKWWRRTRIHVALLGLAIASVNCYAQATFCIAIVEMVLPADYNPKTTATLAPTSQQASAILTIDQANHNGNNHSSLALSASAALVPPKIFPLPEEHSHDDEDESCPIEFKYRDYYDSWRFPASGFINSTTPRATSGQTIDVSNRFNWDAGQQGLLLGAFAFGTAPLQVVGGRLAEIYGAKWVLLAGCIGTAVTNLTIPYLAHWSFILLLLNRFIMGISQAGMEPGLMCFLAEWLTPSEAGFFISMLLFAICIGFFLGSLLSSFILALGYGWPLAYYVSGGLNLVIGLLWFWYADSWPQVSSYISSKELNHILGEQRKLKQKEEDQIRDLDKYSGDKAAANMSSFTEGPCLANGSQKYTSEILYGPESKPTKLAVQEFECSQQRQLEENDEKQQVFRSGNRSLNEPNNTSSSAPWLNILSTGSVWAFIICKISIRWCADVLSNELPTYLANVLHLSIEINGILNGVSSALFAIFSFLTGWLVNEISLNRKSTTATIEEEDMSKTKLRKIFQSTASFGSALAVFLMTRYDCDLVVSMSMLLILSCCIVMGTGGELQIPYDMTTRYPGTLHGMACTLSVSGWLAPPLIGLILGDKPSSRERWHLVWYLTAAINLIGGLVFVLFADASPRDFDRKGSRRRGKGNVVEGAAQLGADASYANAACSSGSSAASSCQSSPKFPAAHSEHEARGGEEKRGSGRSHNNDNNNNNNNNNNSNNSSINNCNTGEKADIENNESICFDDNTKTTSNELRGHSAVLSDGELQADSLGVELCELCLEGDQMGRSSAHSERISVCEHRQALDDAPTSSKTTHSPPTDKNNNSKSNNNSPLYAERPQSSGSVLEGLWRRMQPRVDNSQLRGGDNTTQAASRHQEEVAEGNSRVGLAPSWTRAASLPPGGAMRLGLGRWAGTQAEAEGRSEDAIGHWPEASESDEQDSESATTITHL